jgi:hypothetical protein
VHLARIKKYIVKLIARYGRAAHRLGRDLSASSTIRLMARAQRPHRTLQPRQP